MCTNRPLNDFGIYFHEKNLLITIKKTSFASEKRESNNFKRNHHEKNVFNFGSGYMCYSI